MSPRPDVSEERKAQILEAAAIVVSQRGFADTRMDDIADEAGLSKGTLYLYFKNKEAIKIELMRRFFSTDTEALKALETAEGSAFERLMSYVDAGLARLSELSTLSTLLNEFYALATRHDEMREFFSHMLASYRQSVRTIIQQGIDRGELRPTNADQVAVMFSALFEGLILLSVIAPHDYQLERDLKTSVTRLLDGLVPAE